ALVVDPTAALDLTTNAVTVTYGSVATTGDQAAAALAYHGLTVDNSAGDVLLTGSTSVAGALTLDDGNLDIGAHTLTLEGAAQWNPQGGDLLSATNGVVIYAQTVDSDVLATTNYGHVQ